jgi:hypothetical protein
MKKKIIGSFLIIVIAAVAAFNVNLNMEQDRDISPMALANMEALAGENDGQGIFKCEEPTHTQIIKDIQYCNGWPDFHITQETKFYSCSAMTEVYGSCKVGQIHTYFICEMVHSRHDLTNNKGTGNLPFLCCLSNKPE